MAHYDRRFLVPYLHDVATSEFLYSKLEREISACNARIDKLNSYIHRKVVDPVEPHYSDYQYRGRIPLTDYLLMAFWAFIGITVGFWIMKLSFLIGLIPIAIAGFIIWITYYCAKDAEEKETQEYYKALSSYRNTIKRNQEWRSTIPQYRASLEKEQRTLAILKRRLANAETLKDNVYSVNVIPITHRDIHAAYYLYQYFSTSRETDLDKIIQTMLLDQIKQQLATVIVQNERILLNQRIQIALQERQDSDAADFQRRELQMLAKMERNQQLQLDYQNMLAQNQCVTNFLLAADYLHNIR